MHVHGQDRRKGTYTVMHVHNNNSWLSLENQTGKQR